MRLNYSQRQLLVVSEFLTSAVVKLDVLSVTDGDETYNKLAELLKSSSDMFNEDLTTLLISALKEIVKELNRD